MSRFNSRQIDESAYGEAGYFCEMGQYQYILPRTERFIDRPRNLFVFGYAGVDSIEFVLKPEEDDVYAYYPMEDEFRRLAPDFASFISGWIRGSIGV